MSGMKDFYKFNIWREEPGVSDNSRVELFLYTARSREDQVTCDWWTLLVLISDWSRPPSSRTWCRPSPSS